MAKLNIDFVLLDESVVMNGFRCLMSGADLEQFKKNPVMLFMHARAQGGYFESLSDDAVLPIGKWTDIRVEGGRLLAKPEFDDDDEFALKVQKKVEKGYLSGASVWLDPIAVSDDPALMLQGQRGPTVTKWGVLESSIVDIPNCKGSLAMRNAAGKKIQLSGNPADDDGGTIDYLNTFLTHNNNLTMNKELLAKLLGLDKNAADEAFENKLKAIINDASQFATINGEKGELTRLKAENKELKDSLVALQGQAEEEKINKLVGDAIAAKKIVEADKEKYTKLAKADFDTTKELIDAMKPYTKLGSLLNNGLSEGEQKEFDELSKLSGTQLYKDGKMERLKELDKSGETFKLKYKEAFKIDYKG